MIGLLPTINAALNALSAVLLVLGYVRTKHSMFHSAFSGRTNPTYYSLFRPQQDVPLFPERQLDHSFWA